MLFESGATDHLNSQILAAIHETDAEAAKIRENGGAPALDLKEKVDMLRTSVIRARLETIAAIDGEIDSIRATWEKNRDRNPDRELARIRRAENEINALTDAECADLALRYSADAEDLGPAALNALRARLRMSGAEAEMDVLTDAIHDRRDDRPWISGDPEATKLADYRDKLDSLTGSQVLYDGEQGTAALEFMDLIDFDGELDAVLVE